MKTAQTLYQDLIRLDRRSYKAYKEIAGHYQFPEFLLIIDYVQGDPFAAPSRLRIQMPQTVAKFPKVLYQSHCRGVALRDYLHRQFDQMAKRIQAKRGSGKSGLIEVACPVQQVLERSAVWIDDEQVEVRFTVGLPARGRTILGRQAAAMLCEDLPKIIDSALKHGSLNASAVQRHVETAEDADWLRQQLAQHHLVAFIPNGAILPRQSGVEDLPLKDAIPFSAPASLRVEFDRPNQGKIAGMGIPQGITLIVGGGYHGKSTLLKAISLGVYNHIPDDGREQVVTDSTAVKIRAEDGRNIVGVDVSPFINHLPQGKSTTAFSTSNASGSTSQAANIMEALEVGAKVLLVDEDTSATNFMIRDRRMQALIAKHNEPITPFIDKIRQLDRDHQVSTILVMGGSGDYFDVADTVIAMTEFLPENVAAQAKAIAADYQTNRVEEGGEKFGSVPTRMPVFKQSDSPKPGRPQPSQWRNAESSEELVEEPSDASLRSNSRSPRVKVRDVDELVFGSETVDLSAIEQLVDTGQLRAIGAAMAQLQSEQNPSEQNQSAQNKHQTMLALLTQLVTAVETHSLDCLTPYPQGDLTQFRVFELAAVINRLRSLEIQQ